MTADKLNRLWLLTTGIIVFIIVTSTFVLLINRDSGAKTISLQQNSDTVTSDSVVIEGSVNNPGTYIVHNEDTIHDLIEAAGGFRTDADASQIKIIVPSCDLSVDSQKIDINRADVWLLQALPGIGEIRARAIVDYRSQNGPFNNIEDITRVEGINQSTYDKIKNLITISK
jgi:competence protein ComEA